MFWSNFSDGRVNQMLLGHFKIIEDKLPDHILVIAGRPLHPRISIHMKENLLQNIIAELNLQEKVFYSWISKRMKKSMYYV